MTALILFLLKWRPKRIWGLKGEESGRVARGQHGHAPGKIVQACMPWAILSILVFVWGLPHTKAFLDHLSSFTIPVRGLHNMVLRMPPVVAKPSQEGALYLFTWLSAAGTSILAATVISGIAMRCGFRMMVRTYWKTILHVRLSLLTISAMMALGFLTRYAGLDATLGLAFARTGILYPFFGALLGWLGVALTGSDTSSNVLFGSLQRITAEHLGVSPVLMASANSCGGVMGKMADAQSIVVASAATQWYGHEGEILRYVFFHSIALASLVGLLVFLEAYVFPFTRLVVH